jgi:hypothetical protein
MNVNVVSTLLLAGLPASPQQPQRSSSPFEMWSLKADAALEAGKLPKAVAT